MERLDALAALIQQEQQNILADWKRRVREIPKAKTLNRLALEDGMGVFLDELSNALIAAMDSGRVLARVGAGPGAHGVQRFDLGFTIGQVVLEYNMLRHALQDFAETNGISLDGVAGHTLHEI